MSTPVEYVEYMPLTYRRSSVYVRKLFEVLEDHNYGCCTYDTILGEPSIMRCSKPWTEDDERRWLDGEIAFDLDYFGWMRAA